MKRRSTSHLMLLYVATNAALACAVSTPETPAGSGGNVTTSGGSSGAGGAVAGSGETGGGGAGNAGVATSGSAGSLSATGASGGSAGTISGSSGAAGASAGGTSGSGAGSAGSSGSAGSAAGSASGGAGSAGTAGTAGTGTTGPGCSDGCAEISVPFAAIDTSQDVDIYLASATDLTGRVIAFRVRTTAAAAGGFQVFAKNGEALDYAYVKSGWHDFSTASAWTDVTLDLATATPDASNASFDVTQVSIITLQLHAGGGEKPANPTVAQVDAVTLTPAATVGPWPFTADAMALKLSNYMPIAGSSVTFVPAEAL